MGATAAVVRPGPRRLVQAIRVQASRDQAIRRGNGVSAGHAFSSKQGAPSQGFTVMQFKVGVKRKRPVNKRIQNHSNPVSVGVANANCLVENGWGVNSMGL